MPGRGGVDPHAQPCHPNAHGASGAGGEEGGDKLEGFLGSGRVVIVCATDEEAAHVVGELDAGSEEHRLRRWRFVRGRVGQRRVDVLVCRIGAIHSAIAAATMCATHVDLPAALLSVGCAGAHEAAMAVGDVVIATSVTPLDAARLRRDGSRIPDGIRTTFGAATLPAYECDSRLVAVARAAARQPLPAWPGSPAGNLPRVWVGKVGSTDVFTSFPAALRMHKDASGTMCEEMEAASVAAVAHEFGDIPFIAIKDIANNELHSQTEHWNSMPQTHEFGRRAAVIVGRMLRVLAHEQARVPEDVVERRRCALLSSAAVIGGISIVLRLFR